MNGSYTIDRTKFLSTEEVRQLLKTCEEKSIVDLQKGRTTWVTRYFLVHLALHTGLRVMELADLQIGDLYLKGVRDMYLIVRHGKGRGKKGKKRVVYIDREIVKHINKYIDYKKKVLKQSVNPSSPLLSPKADKKYSTTGLHLSFKRAIEAAGLPNHFSIHACRHTYCCLLYAKSGNLRFCQKQMGHSSINMTSLYADVLPELNTELANSILD